MTFFFLFFTLEIIFIETSQSHISVSVRFLVLILSGGAIS